LFFLVSVGTLIGNYLRFGSTSTLWQLKILIPHLFSFLLGAFIGGMLHISYDFRALYFPAGLTSLIGVCAFIYCHFHATNDIPHDID
jgi:uncharacterized membrane protein YoaK (UPF0700 family)